MKKTLKIIICVLLIAAVPFAVAALNGKENSSGGFKSDIVNRVCFSADKTEFYPEKDSGGNISVSFVFSAKKTQADFWAIIKSFDISGLQYESLVFTPLNDASQKQPVSLLPLPAENGEPVELSWEININFGALPAGVYAAAAEVEYLSGITQNSSGRYLMSIPLTITVS